MQLPSSPTELTPARRGPSARSRTHIKAASTPPSSDEVIATTIYGIASCDKVRSARIWLEERGVPFRFHDFRRDGLTSALLDRWCEQVEWSALLNRQGTTWRKLDAALTARAQDRAGAAALMLQLRPSLTSDQARALLHSTAISDATTGVTPNNDWGFGKINIPGLIDQLSPGALSTHRVPARP